MEPETPTAVTTKLLLIEDDPVQVRLLGQMLRGGGYEIAVTGSLTNAFTASAADDADMVVLDLGLPEGGGLETFYRCKERWPDLPLVVLSGLQDESVAQEAVRAGAQDYLVKGDINARALRRALAYARERHRNSEERRLLMRELDQSRKLEAIGQLAAGVAHEINTPTQYVSDNTRFLRDAITVVLGALEQVRLLARDKTPPSPEDVERILAEAEVDYLLTELPRTVDQSLEGLAHIARIVRAMKEFSHPAVDEKSPADLNRALETVLVVASNECKYVADVATDFDPDLPLVECLPGEMNQVFLNLVVNAAHAIADVVAEDPRKRGRITVRTRLVEDTAVVCIEDTGTGIAPEHRDKLFEPFFTTKEVGKGTGQGLAIAHSVVVGKHGGRITFESEEGVGTSFVIQLPLRAESGKNQGALEVRAPAA